LLLQGGRQLSLPGDQIDDLMDQRGDVVAKARGTSLRR